MLLRKRRSALLGLIGCLLLAGGLSASDGLPPNCTLTDFSYDGKNSKFLICVPEVYNGDLVVFAHGFVPASEPVDIPWDQLQLPGGGTLPELVNSLGYGFATSSFPKNGLAIKEGLEDIYQLVEYYKLSYPANRVYVTGASEGGLIATLAVEHSPGYYNGGLTLCAPLGDFRKQLNHIGDFRVVFDYFFPGVLPPSPIQIPDEVIEHWTECEGCTPYAGQVLAAIHADPAAAGQLLNATHVRTDFLPESTDDAVFTLLGYNVLATNEAQQELGGQPFDNSTRYYFGSGEDFLLNMAVERFAAAPAALAEVDAHYQTSGTLLVPLVNMHTTRDPLVLLSQQQAYALKVLWSGSSPNYTPIALVRYGHCRFAEEELLAAFTLLVLRVTASELPGAEAALPTDAQRQQFRDLLRQFQGVQPGAGPRSRGF